MTLTKLQYRALFLHMRYRNAHQSVTHDKRIGEGLVRRGAAIREIWGAGRVYYHLNIEASKETTDAFDTMWARHQIETARRRELGLRA